MSPAENPDIGSVSGADLHPPRGAAFRLFSPSVIGALLGLVMLGAWIRYQFFLANGGLDPSYVDWAQTHFFGGLTSMYQALADALLNRQRISSIYPPGYPLFLAACKAGHLELQQVRIVQGVLDSFTVVPLFYILRSQRVQPWIALGAGAVYAVAPSYAFGSVMLVAEAFSPMFVVWLIALMLAVRTRGLPTCFLVGGATAVVAEVRPDLQLLLLPMLASCAFVEARFDWKRPLLALIGFFVVVSPWAVYNRVYNHQWVVTSSAGSYALWSGLGQIPNDYGYVVSDENASNMLSARGMLFHSPEAEEYFKQEYRAAWRERPGFVLRTIWYRWSTMPFAYASAFQAPPGYEPGFDAFFSRWGPYALALALPVLLLVRRGRLALVVVLPFAYALLSLGLIYYEPRYVRYLFLSYIFAAAALVDVAWVLVTQGRFSAVAGRGLPPGLRGLAARLSEAVLLCGLVVVLLRGTVPIWIEARSAEAAFHTRQAARAGTTETLLQLPALMWVAGTVKLRQAADGAVEIEGSGQPGLCGYSDIDVAGFDAVNVHYDVEVQAGSIQLVTACDDGSGIAFSGLLFAGRHQGDLGVGLLGRPTMRVALYDGAPDKHTRATIRALKISYEKEGMHVERLSEQRRMAALAAASKPQPLIDLVQLPWRPSVPGVEVKVDGSVMHVHTDAQPWAYQLMTTLDVSGLAGVQLHYDVNVLEGGFALGLLKEDGSTFVTTANSSGAGRREGVLRAEVHDARKLHVVILNYRAEGGRSTFDVRGLLLESLGPMSDAARHRFDVLRGLSSRESTPLAQMRGLQWRRAVEDMKHEFRDDGMHVETDRSTEHYQLLCDLDARGCEGLEIQYDARVGEGGLSIGIVEQRSGNNLGTVVLPGSGTGALRVPLIDSTAVHLVIKNHRAVEGRSSFVLRRLDVLGIPAASRAESKSPAASP